MTRSSALAIIFVIGGTNAEAENARAFAVLCQAYRATFKAASPEMYTPPTAEPDTSDIENMKLMTLPETNFTKGKPDGFADNDAWETKKKALMQPSAAGGKPPYQRYSSDKLTAAAHEQLTKLAKEANTAKNAYNTAKQAIATAVASINNNLKLARTATTSGDDNSDDAYDTRTLACTTTSGTKAGKSIVSDIACICASASGTNVCGNGIGDTNYRTGGTDTATAAKTAFQAVKQHCPGKKTATPPTAEHLAAIIAGVANELGTTVRGAKGPTILGGGNTAACTGETGTQNACVDYKTPITAGGVDAIPWVQKFHAATQAMKSAQAEASKMRSAAHKVEALTATARTLYDSIGTADLAVQLATAANSKQPANPTAAKPEKSEATKKCKPDTKENECNDKDCEFKDGKCKVKEGVKAEKDDKTTTNTT
uniref:Variant surface glycoprotein 1125.1290 n=1 Tax=Trypanosoma brucei TaxID=5691 RepID=A0A1J0R6S0_9TRYP|nr:variant surface glycoprotein 1125.1290 [Trypanosoma brucei]